GGRGGDRLTRRGRGGGRLDHRGGGAVRDADCGLAGLTLRIAHRRSDAHGPALALRRDVCGERVTGDGGHGSTIAEPGVREGRARSILGAEARVDHHVVEGGGGGG